MPVCRRPRSAFVAPDPVIGDGRFVSDVAGVAQGLSGMKGGVVAGAFYGDPSVEYRRNGIADDRVAAWHCVVPPSGPGALYAAVSGGHAKPRLAVEARHVVGTGDGGHRPRAR